MNLLWFINWQENCTINLIEDNIYLGGKYEHR